MWAKAVWASSHRFRARGALLAVLIIGTFAHPAPAAADDARVLRWGDERVLAGEEAFILAGREAPLLERPVLEGRLRSGLLELETADAELVAAQLKPPTSPVQGFASTTLAAGYTGSPYSNSFQTPTAYDKSTNTFVPGSRPFYSTETMNAVLAQPGILDLRLSLVTGPVALDVNPELRSASNWYRLGPPLNWNAGIVADTNRIDINFPYRGIATFLQGPFEIRVGRDKLQLGPGRDSGLSFNAGMPWADFASARVDTGPVSFSWYLVRLNPYLTDDERRWMDALYAGTATNPDPAANHELIHTEAEKNIAVCRLTWRIVPWATMALTQHDMVGGRSIQLSDLNPLIIWHNLFQEGVYGVPITAELSLTPLPGLRVYGQYMLYDAVVADEVGANTDNAGASAYMAGLTAVLRPFGEGFLSDSRLRIDAEFTLTDPWVYGKSFSYRQFSSRYVFVEPYSGRFWVDYPIGPSFGPDAWEADLRIGLGRADGTEIALHPSYFERGSITLIGYGDGSDYSHQSTFHRSGMVFVKSGETPERRLTMGLEAKSKLGAMGPVRFAVKGSFDAVWDWNYGFTVGQDRFWMDASLAVSAAIGN